MCDWADRKQNVWGHRPHSHAYVQVRSVWLNKVSTIVTETETAHLDGLLGLTGKKLTAGLAIILDEINGEAPRISFSMPYPQKDFVEYI